MTKTLSDNDKDKQVEREFETITAVVKIRPENTVAVTVAQTFK